MPRRWLACSAGWCCASFLRSLPLEVQGLAAALEALSDSLALEEVPSGVPGPAGTEAPRPPSRSAEIFGRLDSLESRVSTLEQAGKPEAPLEEPRQAQEFPTELQAEGPEEVAEEGYEQAPEQAPEPNSIDQIPVSPTQQAEQVATGGFGAWSAEPGEPGDMDEKLAYLRDQVQAMAPEQAELLSGIVKDVKYCLKRCELLFQLPEIKGYIKRFQASLHVNAVLQDRWLGPGARTRGVFDDDELEGQKPRPAQTNSMADLSLSNLSTDPITRVRRSEPPNKRPFRTVTDWARPHTPLTVDPVLKSSTPSLPDILPSK